MKQLTWNLFMQEQTALKLSLIKFSRQQPD